MVDLSLYSLLTDRGASTHPLANSTASCIDLYLNSGTISAPAVLWNQGDQPRGHGFNDRYTEVFPWGGVKVEGCPRHCFQELCPTGVGEEDYVGLKLFLPFL